MDHWTALLTAIAGVLGALVYIARLARRGPHRLDQLAALPAAHAQLAETTEQNTAAIAKLSTEVAWLRAAMSSSRRQR